MGPPTVPPTWLRFRPSPLRAPSGPTRANGLVALKRWLRQNSKPPPWNRLVPDLVTPLTDAPECTPVDAPSAPVSTRNSCSASGNGSGRLRLSYGLLCIAPSSTYAVPVDNPPATAISTPPELPTNPRDEATPV